MPVRALIQRVTHALVTVGNEVTGRIHHGLLVFLGVEPADASDDIDWLAGKIARLRIFADERGAMNQSIQETGGDILVVSQFTLYASTRKGNRPSFIAAAAPPQAEALYEQFCARLEIELSKAVQRGVFGARMEVELLNDGPVTIWIDTKNRE